MAVSPSEIKVNAEKASTLPISTNTDQKQKSSEEEKKSKEESALIPAFAQAVIKSSERFESIILLREGGKFPSTTRGQKPGLDRIYNAGITCFQQKNLKDAYINFKAATEQGHLNAMVDFALCLEAGWGVEQNVPQAIELYTLAANAGELRAQYALACHLLSGKFVNQSFEGAFYWFKKAADKGLTKAEYQVGKCYEDGIGVEQDETLALEYYQKALIQGEERAKHFLGPKPSEPNSYPHRNSDYNSSALSEWNFLAGFISDSRAEFEIGKRFLSGKGVQRDQDQALLRFKKVIAKNLSDTTRHFKGWYHERPDEVLDLIHTEISAREQVGKCLQNILIEKGFDATTSNGLIPFHHILTARSRWEALKADQMLTLLSPQERTENAKNSFTYPFDVKFYEFTRMLNTLKVNAEHAQIIKFNKKGDFVISGYSDEWNRPGQDLVLWHPGPGNIVIEALNFNCKNLYVICEKGGLNIKENSAFGITGEILCLTSGDTVVENCIIDAALVCAFITNGKLKISTEFAGNIKAQLGVFFGAEVSVKLYDPSLLDEVVNNVTPAKMKEYVHHIMKIILNNLKAHRVESTATTEQSGAPIVPGFASLPRKQTLPSLNSVVEAAPTESQKQGTSKVFTFNTKHTQ